MTRIPLPRSPFSTPLSGSAKEAEERIRNIFQYKKKRPPILGLAAACALALLCGGLVSCQPVRQSFPTLVMDTQYYDSQGNYIEIPALAVPGNVEPDEGVTAINQALAELKGEYAALLTILEDGIAPSPGSTVPTVENHCLLYPTQTERYLNLVLFRETFATDLNSGHVLTLVYDREEGRQMSLSDALELAGQTEEGLCQALAEQSAPQLAQQSQEITQNQAPGRPSVDLALQNQALEGFRMGADGQPIFYLTARVDDRDDAVNDAVSSSDNLYIWSGGTFSRYEQYAADDLQPLVPAEETMELDPPLWCQWYFTGGEPEGGFAAPASPMPPSQTVLGRAEDYGLRSLEYSLWRDGWETPAGPGMQTSALFFDEPGTRIERPDEGLTQNEGDYWLTYEWEGLSAGYYHLAADSSETLGSIDTTRTDVATWRGVRVGDSREDVQAAYPEAKSQSDRILSLNEENCLWIAEDLEQDRGLALLFYLDGDTVRQITLTRFLS